jgi:hypothetical protein
MEVFSMTRFLSNLALTLAAAFLVVAEFAFTLGTAAWLTFALGIGFVVISGFMLIAGRSIVQRSIGGLGLMIGAWTIVASLVFVPATVMWLGFASAVALVALGVTGLTAHELTTERVVHSLQVERQPVAVHEREPIAA